MPLKDITLIKLSDSNEISVTLLSDPNKNNIDFIQGSNNLVQRIIKLLLTNPGSYYFNSKLGVPIYSLIGNTKKSEKETIESAIIIYIKELTKYLLVEQQELLDRGEVLWDSETLEDIQVQSIEYDNYFSGWFINLKIITKGGPIGVRFP